MLTSLLFALIEPAAAQYGVPEALVRAIVMRESRGEQYAWNPEPRYRWFWDVKKQKPFRTVTDAEIRSEIPPDDFPCLAGDRDQEWWAQQASWGLMQVMGAVARERGCRAPYLPQLCDAQQNIDYGCRHLADLKRRYFAASGWPGVIAAYNAGSPRTYHGQYENQGYVDAVLRLTKGALA